MQKLHQDRQRRRLARWCQAASDDCTGAIGRSNPAGSGGLPGALMRHQAQERLETRRRGNLLPPASCCSKKYFDHDPLADKSSRKCIICTDSPTLPCSPAISMGTSVRELPDQWTSISKGPSNSSGYLLEPLTSPRGSVAFCALCKESCKFGARDRIIFLTYFLAIG